MMSILAMMILQMAKEGELITVFNDKSFVHIFFFLSPFEFLWTSWFFILVVHGTVGLNGVVALCKFTFSMLVPAHDNVWAGLWALSKSFWFWLWTIRRYLHGTFINIVEVLIVQCIIISDDTHCENILYMTRSRSPSIVLYFNICWTEIHKKLNCV